MCFFPISNNRIDSLAYRKGVTAFDCGSCPECMRKRSNVWVLRSVHESRSHLYNCMITLTYDTFKYINNKIAGENPVDPTIKVCKRDVQLFLKRLRSWYFRKYGETFKYIVAAEYGSKTHRAHYHAILFGVRFFDMHFYKKSKRGNRIYLSKTLTDLWGNGICTIDSVNVSSAIARYCTKYLSKSRSGDSFMLCSQHIGFESLYKNFNGFSYYIDGREFPIPRFIWNSYIMSKYSQIFPHMDYRYVNFSDESYFSGAFKRSILSRKLFRLVRDRDPLYASYLDYWHRKGIQFESRTIPILQRINLLPDRKYHFYKIAALNCLSYHNQNIPVVAPGSNCVSNYYRYAFKFRLDKQPISLFCSHLSLTRSRPNRASDTFKPVQITFFDDNGFRLNPFNKFFRYLRE